MKKHSLFIFALGLVAGASAQVYQTGFEKTEGNGWDATGATNSWSANGFAGNVNVIPGTGFVQSTGVIIAGAQSAQLVSTTSNVTDYSATRSFTASKKLFVRSLFQPLTISGNRAFGVIGGSGWRAYVGQDGTGTYGLYASNGATFTTTKLATVSNPIGAVHYISMEVDISTIGTGTGILRVKYDNTVYNAAAFNVTSTTSGLGTAGILSRAIGSSSGSSRFDEFGYTAVPEPASMLALAAGASALVARRKKNKNS